MITRKEEHKMGAFSEIYIRASLAKFRSDYHLGEAKDDQACQEFDNSFVKVMENYFDKSANLDNFNKYLIDVAKIKGCDPFEDPGSDKPKPADALAKRFYRRLLKRLLLNNKQLILDEPQQKEDSDGTSEESDNSPLMQAVPKDDEAKPSFADIIKQAVSDEINNLHPADEKFFIGFKDPTASNEYKPYNTKSRVTDIRAKTVTSPAPDPDKINPVTWASNITSLIDNTLSTAGDRVVKTILTFLANASTVLKEVHTAFSWIGFAVSFLYTITFFLSYVWRKAQGEDVQIGPRDVARGVLSLMFLTLSIAATFVTAAAFGPLFTLGFPVIAGISAFFSLGEHLYDYHVKNVNLLKKVEDDIEALNRDIVISQKLAESQLKLLNKAYEANVLDIDYIKHLRQDIARCHEQIEDKKSQIIALLDQKRGLLNTQTRLRDPVNVFNTGLRTFVGVVTIIGAALVVAAAVAAIANPLIGLGIVAACGVLGLIAFGIAVFNKYRLDKKFEREAAELHADIGMNDSTHKLAHKKFADHPSSMDLHRQDTSDLRIERNPNRKKSGDIPLSEVSPAIEPLKVSDQDDDATQSSCCTFKFRSGKK